MGAVEMAAGGAGGQDAGFPLPAEQLKTTPATIRWYGPCRNECLFAGLLRCEVGQGMDKCSDNVQASSR